MLPANSFVHVANGHHNTAFMGHNHMMVVRQGYAQETVVRCNFNREHKCMSCNYVRTVSRHVTAAVVTVRR